MTEASRPDAEMDRLLRRTSSQAPDARPTPACLDAETAAAWLAGGLPSVSRDATLAHLADCARCQQLVAALTRLDTEEAAAAEPVAPRPWWAYLVPLGAVAAMLAIVVGLSHKTPPSQPAAPKPAHTEALRDVESRFEAAPIDKTSKKDADAISNRRPALDRERNGATAKLEQPSAPATAADTAVQSAREPAARNAPAPAAPTAQSAAAAPKPPSATGALRANEEQDAKVRTATVVLSPDRNIQWRFRGALVERSTDAGASWTETPVGWTADWTAGFAPSSSICWLVGRSGTVARTVDGRTWQRVAFPAQTDLSAIEASDAQRATATAADGRTFVTTDGGNTWIPRVVQESSSAPFRD